MRLAVLPPWVIIALTMGPAPAGPLFAPGPPVNVGVGSGAVLLADLNADGHVDMLTRHLTSRTITLSFGGREGSFGRPTVRPLAYEPGDMKLGDLNADGVLDLAVTPGRQDVVHVLLGDGRGDFSPAPGSPFTVTDASDELNKRTLHLIDLNEDTHLDIVTANGRRRNTLGTLLGNGRGGFTRGPVVTLESGRDRYWYAFGDLDGDRHLDVVTASSGLDAAGAAGRLLVQAGNGRGGFTAMSPSPIPIAAGPGPVSLSDVNRDGRLDVAVAHNNGEVSILINSGRGQFAQAPGSPVKLGSRPYALVVQDVNRDHRPDLLAATVDSITVWLGTASGYTPAPGSPFRAGPGAYNFTLGDVNKDGTLDLAASSFEGESVTLLLGRTDGVP